MKSRIFILSHKTSFLHCRPGLTGSSVTTTYICRSSVIFASCIVSMSILSLTLGAPTGHFDWQALFICLYFVRGRRLIGISRFFILSKTLIGLIFNLCGEFRWSPEGSVSQNMLSSPPRWCPWDLFRSLKVCSDAKERVGCGKQWEATAPIQSLVKLQPRFLHIHWRTCPWAEHSDDDDISLMLYISYHIFEDFSFIYHSFFPYKMSDTLKIRVGFMTSSTYLYWERSFFLE